MVASYTSIEAALEPVKLFECIGKGEGDLSSRVVIQPLCLNCRAPAVALRRERRRFRAVWAWLSGLFLPAASLPATASPRSRVSLMITFGFVSTR
jgi:hypothetical protein